MESRLLGMRNGDRGERLGVRQGVRDVCESLSGYLATVLASAKLTHSEIASRIGEEKSMSHHAMRGRSARSYASSATVIKPSYLLWTLQA